MTKPGLITGLVGLAMALHAAPVQQLWEARYNGPINREDLLFAMTVDGSGKVYVTGSSDNNVNPDPYATLKYDTNGTQLWVSRYTGPRAIDSPTAIAVDGQGNVYVTGLSHGTASGYDPDYATVKYAPEGTELWVARYNAHSNGVSTADNPYALVVNSAGEVYVTGASVSAQGSLDFLTLKYATNGAQLWEQRYNGPDNRVDSARAMGIDGSGNIYVAGTSERSDGGNDIAVVKYAPNGTLTWASHFTTQGYGYPPTMAMKVDASGNSYIAFAGQGTSGRWRLAVLKCDSNGDLVWERAHRILRDYGQILVAGAQLDDSDNFCVVTSVNQWGNADYLTIKFGPGGEELWASRFNSQLGYEDQARAIAVDGAGNIYVTGLSYLSGNQYQFATVKYRPNGHREWVAMTTDTSTGGSEAIVQVDGAGHVYVSGSIGQVGTKDYYTIKYRQTPQAGAPVIVSAPTAQTALGGGSATFSVTATGTEPLSYVWRRDGQVIDGANGSSLVLSNLTFAHRGYYSVEVSNSVGTAASPEAALNVIVAPHIVENPQSRAAILGSSVDFSVVAGGTEPFEYQWQHNGTAIPGATNATLVISNLQTGDVGGYAVVVSNAAGSVGSSAAQLTLVPGIEQCFAVAASAPGEWYSFPQAMRVDSQGRTTVAQTAYLGNNETKIVTVQFETNGAVRWLAHYALGTNTGNNVTAMAVDAAGNIYLGGTSSSYEATRLLVVKYDSAGSLIWEASHSSLSNRYEYLSAIGLDAAGNIYVTGSVYLEDEPQDFLTVKFDATGTQQWSRRYGSSAISSDTASDLKVDAAGFVYVFGTTVDTSARLTTIKYDGDGNVVWVRSHECGTQGNAVALRIDSAGNAVVTGTAADGEGNTDVATLKYDANGALLWLAQYTAYPESFDYPYAMALDPAGNIYVAAGSTLPGEPNTGITVFSTLKYDADGNELWVASRTDVSGYGGPDSLAVDSAGNSYLSFSKYSPFRGGDFVTYKYDTSGTRMWVAVSGRTGTLDEYPTGLALDPEGNLLVAGLGTTPPSEVLLVKYKNRAAPGLPAITQVPQSREVAAGSTVQFSVSATGDAPLSYQWNFNGNSIGGAVSASYVIPQATPGNAGHYSVEVRNAVGAVVSASAILTISVPPAIVRQPNGQSVLTGTEVVFDVLATGTRPLHYQWQRNGTNIPGGVGAILRLSNVQAEDAGVYSVVVSNRAASVTSAGAILSVNQNARREWLVILSGGTMIHARPSDMEVDNAGNVYVTGFTESSPPSFLTAKYDSTGHQLWATNFQSPGGAYATALAVDAAGNSYVTGYAWNESGSAGFSTVKYGPNGNELWMREFHPPEQAIPVDISVGADGYIYVTGEAGGATRGITTIKYDSNGVQVWMAHSGGTQNPASGYRVLADAAGNVYVAGTLYYSSRDAVLIKYNSAGAPLWSRIYGDAGVDGVADLALDSAGNAILCVYASTWNTRIATIKYNSTGTVQWVAQFGAEYDHEEPRAMVVDADDNIYVTGLVNVGYTYDEDGNYYANEDVITLKYNSTGVLQWSARYGGRRADYGVDIALDGRGGLYVTGSATGGDGTEDMIVLRYDTNGTRYWADVMAGETGGRDHGLVIRSAGTNCIYALGLSVIGGYESMALLKYTHNAASGAPAITTPPQSQTVVAGTSATFSVTASGDSPLVYRWYFKGSIIPGAFGSSLVIPNVETTNAGSYSVEVSNPAGQVVSADAFLTVRVPGRIVTGPEDQCIVAGSHAVFRIWYEGDGEVNIYWQRNGVPLSADGPTIAITNVSAADTGIYSVTVSNEFGSMTASARLMITPHATLAWASPFNSGEGNHDQATAGAVDANGNVYITGSGPGGIQTIRLDANGAVAWTASYMTNGGNAGGIAIAVGDDGSVYVVGSLYEAGISSQDFATLKYNANGSLLWAARYDHGGYDTPKAIAVDGAGNVYVTGEGVGPSYGVDYVTIKYDPNGNELWVRDYAGPDGGDDRPAALAVDSAGNVYVTGSTMEANTIAYYSIFDYLTLKYDADGNQLWSARHSGPGSADDHAAAIAVDAAGNVYVTGSHSYDYSVNSGTTVYFDYDYATIKYDANGQELWQAVYAGHRPGPDRAADLKVDAQGNVSVTGSSDNDIVTVRYNSAGEQQWVARLDSGASYDEAITLALDTSGNTYVTGHSGDYGDILTFKLDTNGSRIWLARYDGPGGSYGSHDYPVGIGVDLAGNVLVAGSIDSSTTSRDYIALKYAPGTAGGAPSILTPPHDQSAAVGSTVIFGVAASGDAPLRYQWRRNGVAIHGQTNSTLELPAVAFAQSGRYSVVVFNDFDCAVSADAVLVVVAAELVQCTGIERVAGGVRLIVAGPPSYNYRIEATVDFKTWETIATIYNASGVCEHTDPGGLLACRFYRVVKQP